jgi:hypothetical protein
METKSWEEVLLHSLKKLNNGRKWRINMDEWKEIKKMKDARKAHTTWKGKQIGATCPSKQVNGIML